MLFTSTTNWSSIKINHIIRLIKIEEIQSKPSNCAAISFSFVFRGVSRVDWKFRTRLRAEKWLSQPTTILASKIWLQIIPFGDFGIRIRKSTLSADNSVGEWLTAKNPKTRKKTRKNPKFSRCEPDPTRTRPEPEKTRHDWELYNVLLFARFGSCGKPSMR